jgi:hypothetical protein
MDAIGPENWTKAASKKNQRGRESFLAAVPTASCLSDTPAPPLCAFRDRDARLARQAGRARGAKRGGPGGFPTACVQRIFSVPHLPLQRSRQTVLHCAHRTSTVSSCAFREQEGWSGGCFPILPSSLVISQGWGLIDLPLRAAFSPAHPLARRDVPLAHARAFRFSPLCPKGSGQTVLHCAHRGSTF